MFYEMVTGQMPFMAENAYGIMHKHINDAPRPPKELCPKLPLGVQQIILTALEKEPENRYQSAPQMLRNVYSIQRDPTMIFKRQKPALRTPTAEIAIERTTKEPEAPPSAPPPDKKRTPVPGTSIRTEKSDGTAPIAYPSPKKKKSAPEYVPFSVVIMICIVFLVIAVIGFSLLFYFLVQQGKIAEPSSFLQFNETLTPHFSTDLWKSIAGKGSYL
jgi:serine/threonine protein kinase